MARVLLVEDDPEFNFAVHSVLDSDGHEVTAVTDGNAAIHCLSGSEFPFDLVIADLRLPQISGLELSEWIQDHRPVPMILMTGFTRAVTTETALSRGAVNILFKPFTDSDLLRAVQMVLSGELEHESFGKIELFRGFCRIPTSSLLQGGIADFNLYQAIDGALRKVLSKGEAFDKEHRAIRRFSYLYTEEENIHILTSLGILVGKAASKAAEIDVHRKRRLIADSLELIYERMKIYALEPDVIESSTKLLHSYLASIESQSAWKLISELEDHSSHVFVSMFLTSCLAGMVAPILGLGSRETETLLEAAIFHDIGHLRLEPRLTYTSWLRLGHEDRMLVRNHVEFGVSLLSQSNSVSEDTIQIIQQHHENEDGTGYPHQLRSPEIHRLAKVIRALDEFCLFLLKSPGHPGMDPRQALQIIEKLSTIDQGTVDALKKLFKLDQEGKNSA